MSPGGSGPTTLAQLGEFALTRTFKGHAGKSDAKAKGK